MAISVFKPLVILFALALCAPASAQFNGDQANCSRALEEPIIFERAMTQATQFADSLFQEHNYILSIGESAQLDMGYSSAGVFDVETLAGSKIIKFFWHQPPFEGPFAEQIVIQNFLLN